MKRVTACIGLSLILACMSVLSAGCGGSSGEITRKGFYLKLVIADRTESAEAKPSKAFSIRAAGIDLWTPDLSDKENATLIGPVPVGSKSSLQVLPEGDKGKSHKVVFTVKKGMKKESDRDAITVEIFDDRLAASGTPVEGGVQEFAR